MTHLSQPSHSFSVAAPTTVSLGNQRSSCLQTHLSLLTHQSQTSSLFSTSLKTFDVGGWCTCEGNVKTLPHWVRHIEHAFLGWFHFSCSFYMIHHEFLLCVVMICVHKSSLLDLRLFEV